MKIKDIFFNNLWYKLFSILCGFLLWFMVIGQQNSEISVELPLEFKNIPENYMITKSTVHKVSILLSGPSTLLKLIAKKELSFPVDLSNIHKGKNSLVLYPEMLNLPHKITVRIITPSTINLYIDKIVEEYKAVIPKYKGKVAKGFEINKVNIEPSVVKIVGAEDEIKKIDVVKTAPIDIDGKKESFALELPVIINVKYLKSIVPNKIKIKVIISEKFIISKLRNIPIKIKTSLNLDNYKMILSPSSVDIVYKISESFKSIIKKGDFEAFIEIDDIHKNKFLLHINYPNHVKILDISAKEINVNFKKAKK